MVTHDLLYINIDFTSPVLITGLVFVGLFAILSILDCFLGRMRKHLGNICLFDLDVYRTRWLVPD